MTGLRGPSPRPPEALIKQRRLRLLPLLIATLRVVKSASGGRGGPR